MSPTKLPAAAQRQLEEAERIDTELAKPADPAPAPAEPPPEPVAEPPAQPAPTEESWQHKFLTLQGKYNTEVPALRNQVKDLQAELERLKAAPPAPTPEPAKPTEPAPPPKLVTDADVETFGAELVDLMRRVVLETDAGEKAKLQAEIDTLKSRIPTLEKGVETVTAAVTTDAETKYFSELERLVPDWASINVDEAFKGWLTLPDPFSGQVRNDLLQSAFQAFDHKRTAIIFNAFKQETGATPPKPADPPAPAAEPKNDLEALVSPGTSKTIAEIIPDDGKKVWSSQEVGDFYTAVTRGDYRGREAEAKRIDAEIDKALAEGRVRG